MITLTVAECLALNPCSGYTRERITELWAGRERLTPGEVNALGILVDDRIWCLLRMAPREVWMPAVWRCAERAIRYAATALEAAGLHAESARLCALAPIRDVESSRAASDAASYAVSYAASYAASYAVSYAASNASYAASNASYAAAQEQFAADLVACLGAKEEGK